MTDHHHYGEYAEARHDHLEYADDRHDHDVDYAGKHHRHYDLEREDDRLKSLIEQWGADLRELRENLRDALERIRALEDRQPGYSDPEADDEPDPSRCPARGPFTGSQCIIFPGHDGQHRNVAGAMWSDGEQPPRLPRLRPMGACCDRAVYDDSTGWWCPEHGDQP